MLPGASRKAGFVAIYVTSALFCVKDKCPDPVVDPPVVLQDSSFRYPQVPVEVNSDLYRGLENNVVQVSFKIPSCSDAIYAIPVPPGERASFGPLARQILTLFTSLQFI